MMVCPCFLAVIISSVFSPRVYSAYLESRWSVLAVSSGDFAWLVLSCFRGFALAQMCRVSCLCVDALEIGILCNLFSASVYTQYWRVGWSLLLQVLGQED